MSRQSDIIARTGDTPITASRLTDDLRRLGVRSGTTVLMHSSLSALGWVVGGPQAVIEAVRAALGDAGTLVAPTHSSEWSDPTPWQHPPIPEAWWPVVRDHWPAFDRDVTPARDMGVIAETFRTMPGTIRSDHPQLSVATQGPAADAIVRDHSLPYGFGTASPYGRLYDHDAHILLLGVGYENCSMLHLAENRVGPPRIPKRQESFAVRIDGKRRWVTVDDLLHDADRFPAIGRTFEAQTSLVRVGRVGLAEARLIPAKPLVEFAEAYLMDHLK